MATYLGFEPTTEDNYYFISYNSEDSQRISVVLKALVDKKVPIWYDYGIEYGSTWEQIIAERINNAKAVILFLTKGVFEKGQKSYVKREWEIAKFFEKNVYVINMDKIPKRKIPYELVSWYIEICEKQSISALDYSGNALTNEIMKALGISSNDSVPDEEFSYVTYAGSDKDVADTLCTALQKNGIKIVTPYMIPMCSDYATQIHQSIENCSLLIAVISKTGLKSRSFLHEIDYGIQIGKPIIPVMLDNCASGIDGYFMEDSPIKFKGPIKATSKEFQTLVNRIHEYI